MKMDGIIEKKIKENSGVRVNYKSNIDNQRHYIKGHLVRQTKESFMVEGSRYHDIIAIPKKNIISMFFIEPDERQKPKTVIIPDPITETRSKKKERFSYEKLWRDDIDD